MWCGYRTHYEHLKLKKQTELIKGLYFHTIYNIIDNATYPITLRLTDRGEPLFYKKEFIDLTQKIKHNKNIKTLSITTNGLNLLDKDVFEAIIDIKDKIFIKCSLNALTEERHFNIMRIKHYKDIVGALMALRTHNINIQVSFVLQTDDDIKEFDNNILKFINTTGLTPYVYQESNSNQLKKIMKLKKKYKKFGLK